MGEATYTVGQLLVTGLLSKVQNLSSATRQSKFQNGFHTFLFCFLSDRLLAYQIKTMNDTLWVKATPLLISYLSSISCTQIKIHKRGRCGGRQCSNGSPIFFFFAFQGGHFSIASFFKGSEIPAKKIKVESIELGCHFVLFETVNSFSQHAEY